MPTQPRGWVGFRLEKAVASLAAFAAPRSAGLIARARLTIEERRKLRTDRLRLDRERVDQSKALQLSILESAMLRTETKARRDDKSKPSLNSFFGPPRR